MNFMSCYIRRNQDGDYLHQQNRSTVLCPDTFWEIGGKFIEEYKTLTKRSPDLRGYTRVSHIVCTYTDISYC
jgi:hypothetical protein